MTRDALTVTGADGSGRAGTLTGGLMSAAGGTVTSCTSPSWTPARGS